jgi:maltooligosyltrehalose trehalohydrolase
VPDPCARETFLAAKLDSGAAVGRGETWTLYADLLRLRRTDPVIASQARASLDGAVLGAHAFVLRYFDARHGDRLLAVNLGPDLILPSAPEPLLAPPRAARWALAWSSEAPRYGGLGALNPCGSAGWRLPADCATLLRADSAA